MLLTMRDKLLQPSDGLLLVRITPEYAAFNSARPHDMSNEDLQKYTYILNYDVSKSEPDPKSFSFG